MFCSNNLFVIVYFIRSVRARATLHEYVCPCVNTRTQHDVLIRLTVVHGCPVNNRYHNSRGQSEVLQYPDNLQKDRHLPSTQFAACNTIQYNAIQYNTIQYNTIQYNTIQYNTIQYNTIHYNTLHYTTLHYSTIQYNTIQYNTIHYNTLHYTTLHYTTLHYTTLHYSTIQYNTIQYNTIQYNTIQYNTIQYNTIQYNTIQYTTIQYNTTQHNTQHNTTQHNTTQHNTTQHNTTQHNTTQHNTTQHNTTQHNTTQHNTTQHNTTQHNTTQHNTIQPARQVNWMQQTANPQTMQASENLTCFCQNHCFTYDHAILKKARAVATESDHPLSTFFHVLPSQRRYRCIKRKTSCYSRSFVPVAIIMLNAKLVILMSPG